MARRVVVRRAELGLSQRKLASACGVARSYIGLIEGAQAPGLSVTLLARLCVALALTPNDLVAWEQAAAG